MEVTINGVTTSIDINFGGGDVEDWHYMGVSV